MSSVRFISRTSEEVRRDYLTAVVEAVESLLTFQRPEGPFVGPEEEWLGLSQQGVIYPLAYLFATDLPDNRYFGDERLLTAAVRLGNWLVDSSDDVCRLLWPIPTFNDYTFDRRLISAWLEAYLLLKEHLSPSVRDRWEAKLRSAWGYLGWACDKILTAPHFSGPHLGTGTNHRALEVSLAVRLARAFDEKAWLEKASAAADKFLRDQHPDGYWTEHHGPATRYNYLSMTAAGLLYEYTGSARALEAVRRSLNFYLNWTYPDGSPIGTIDERNRYSATTMYWGHFALSNWPEGRTLAALMQENLREFWQPPFKGLHLEASHRYIENWRYWHDGPMAESIPPLQERYQAALSDPAVVEKAGPWVLTLCGIPTPHREGNRFYLDRQGLLGLWREGIGEVLDQSGSRDQPELATLTVMVDGRTVVIPSQSDISRQNGTWRMRMRFGGVPLELSAWIVDYRTVVLRAARASDAAGAVTFAVRPALKVGEVIEFGSGRDIYRLTLGRLELRLGSEVLGQRLVTPRCVIEFDRPAEFVWPILPYSPYNVEKRYGYEMAVSLLRFDLKTNSEVSVTVTARQD